MNKKREKKLKFYCKYCGVIGDIGKKDILQKEKEHDVTKEIKLITTIKCPICKEETIKETIIKRAEYEFRWHTVLDYPDKEWGPMHEECLGLFKTDR